MVFKRISSKKKVWLFFNILFFYLVGTSYADFTAQFGSSFSNLKAVQSFYDKNKSIIPEDFLICINKGKYNVVDTEFLKSRELVNKKINTLKIKNKNKVNILAIEIDKKKCFNKNTFLVFEPGFKNKGAKNKKSKSTFFKFDETFFKKNTDNDFMKLQNGEILENTEVLVYPEMTTKVDVSSTDINRFICQGGSPVKDIIVSKEKNISYIKHGNNAYIKFLVSKNPQTGETFYRNEPAEIYIICGKESINYSIIALPKEIPAQKVILKSSIKNKIKKNHSLFQGTRLEEKITKIFKECYLSNFPDSYSISKVEKTIPISNFKSGSFLSQMNIQLSRKIKIEGQGLLIKEFFLSPKQKIKKNIDLREEYFLDENLSRKPLGIMLSDLSFIPGKREVIRLYVLEQ